MALGTVGPLPVGQHVPGELCAEVHHPEAEVRVVEGHVVGDGPHDDQVDVLLAELPRDHAGGAWGWGWGVGGEGQSALLPNISDLYVCSLELPYHERNRQERSASSPNVPVMLSSSLVATTSSLCAAKTSLSW